MKTQKRVEFGGFSPTGGLSKIVPDFLLPQKLVELAQLMLEMS